MSLRNDFIWGVSTSAFQIEGASTAGGRGKSIWDVYCEDKGHIRDGSDGSVACDHYHRYKEDIALLKELGVKHYRFSISWTRIFPEGIGEVSEEGIRFYNDLIDELLKNGIEPYVTLFHWDFPYALYLKGGWLNPESPKWFAEYTKVVAERFSDRVKYFITFNEPQCFIGIGFQTGTHAPGQKASTRDILIMTHNVLKAHGEAVRTLRKYGKQKLLIGYAPTCRFAYPETDKPEDIEAARQATFEVPTDEFFSWNVSWWSDPVLLGRYPEEAMERFKPYMDYVSEEDMKLISEPIDFYGQNIYQGKCIRMGADGKPEEAVPEGVQPGQADYRFTPKSLYWGPKFLWERYGKPVIITENGTCCEDQIAADGGVHDAERIRYLDAYIGELKRAAEDGVDVRGYFLWSLLDNFEWDSGYTARFGITYVDYETQKRTLKDSALWYRDLIQKNGETLSNK